MTTDTSVSVKEYDPVLILMKGALFAAFNAGGIITMIANPGQEEFADMRIAAGLICFDFTSESSERDFIFGFTGDLTGITADAPVNINKHGIFFFLFGHFFNLTN
jgi:hypothetical protein